MTVYIAEAHARDEWPVGDHLDLGACSLGACDLTQAKTLRERREAARLLIRELEWPFEVYVDAMGDAFEQTFAAWPLRFYLVNRDGATLAHVAHPVPGTYGYAAESLAAAVERSL